MTLSFLIILILTLQAFYWYIGKRASKKVQTQSDYFLAGKTVSFFPLMMTFIGAQVGGGLVLGAADAAFEYGWWVLLYPMGACLGLLALGFGVGKRLASFNASTVAQILEIGYGSKALKKIASSLSILSLFMILSAQVYASYTFLVSLGVESLIFFVLFWGVIIAYTVLGGLRAVIATDSAQAIVFSLIFLGSFFYLFVLGEVPSFEINQSSYSLALPKISGWLLMPFFYMLIEQDMAQRCFAGKNAKVISKAAIFASISTMLICLIPTFFGILAKNKGLILGAGESTLMKSVTYIGGPLLTALVGCSVLAAIVSTSSSLMSAISSNLSLDFDLFKEKGKLQKAKWITFFIALSAIFVGFYSKSIVGTLIESYELFVSSLFIPIFLVLFRRKGNTLSAFLAITLGVSGFILLKIFPPIIPREICNIGLSFTGYLLGEISVSIQSRANKIKI